MSYKAAVIGCGRMGAFTSDGVKNFSPKCWFPLSHIEAIQAHKKLKLIAIADTNKESLLAASQRYAASNIYQNVNKLFLENKIEVLSIATRTDNRVELMLSAIKHGVKAMHVEKPLCNSMLQLRKCEEEILSKNIYLTLGTLRRYMSPYIAAVKIANSGIYGELKKIEVNMGYGNLYWTHPHSVDLLLLAAQNRGVQSVSAKLVNVISGESLYKIKSDPMVCEAKVRFAGGVDGIISNQGGCDFVLSCETAKIFVEADGHRSYIYKPSVEGPYYEKHDINQPYEGFGGTLSPLAHLVECIDGNQSAIDLNVKIKSDVFLGQKILFGFMQSHIQNGKEIQLNEISSDMEIMAESGGKYA